MNSAEEAAESRWRKSAEDLNPEATLVRHQVPHGGSGTPREIPTGEGKLSVMGSTPST